MPPLKELWLQISGRNFPSSDGLNNVTLPELKDYTEHVENVSTGVNMASYGSYWFYTLFDYTGHQNLFITPSISVDVGEKTNARLV